jgi:hypothetical protein
MVGILEKGIVRLFSAVCPAIGGGVIILIIKIQPLMDVLGKYIGTGSLGLSRLTGGAGFGGSTTGNQKGRDRKQQ